MKEIESENTLEVSECYR